MTAPKTKTKVDPQANGGMVTPKLMAVPTEVVAATVQYLQSQPYGEVAQLIQALSQSTPVADG